MRATVLGAGVAGLACAVELAGRGVTVEVLERGADPTQWLEQLRGAPKSSNHAQEKG